MFQEHGVDQLFYLEPNALSTDADAVVYLVRPRVELMPGVAAQVRTLARRTRQEAGLSAGSAGATDGDAPWPPEQRCVFMPRRTLVCDKVLEEEGVLGDVVLSEVVIQWLPLERDLLTLAAVDTRTSLHDAVVMGDAATGVHALAKALHSLQRGVTGTIPLVRGKGPAARQVADLLLRLRKEEFAASGGGGDGGGNAGMGANVALPPPAGYSPPYALVLLDRAVDWVTPMCTPLTYEGLVDEVLGIVNGVVTVPADPSGAVTPPATSSLAGRKTRLDSRDALFAELRDVNFGAACDALRAKTASLAQDYRSIKGDAASAAGPGAGSGSGAPQVRELGGFVKRLRDNMGGAGVDLHATLAKALLDRTKTRPFMARLAVERGLIDGGKEGVDAAVEAAEALCMQGAPVEDVLRLWSLLALTTGGGGPHVPPKKWDALRRDLIHAYGPRHVASLQHCAAAGLLSAAAAGLPPSATPAPQPPFSPGFPACRAPLQLVVDALETEGDEQTVAAPGDIAFTHSHSGYAPLSVRLAALGARPGGWRAERPVEEALKQLPGPTFELAQGVDERGAPAELGVDAATAHATWHAACAACGPGKTPPVLVVFVGGVARTEMAALRWLSSRGDAPGGPAPTFVTLATSVLSAKAVMAALVDGPEEGTAAKG